MLKKVFVIGLLLLALCFAGSYGGGGSSGGSSDSGGGDGTVNKPTGCAVEKCEQLSIDVFEPICTDKTLGGIKVVIKDSRGMAVEGASVFLSGRFLGLPTRTTDSNGEVVFDKGFVEKQRYTLSASKSGKPGYDELYGYKPPESKNFVYGEGEITCDKPITPTDPGSGTRDYCYKDDACNADEVCNTEMHACAGLGERANGLYPDGCFTLDDHKITRDPCCDNYELVVGKDTGFVGDFVPIEVRQCNVPLANTEVEITDPTGVRSTVSTTSRDSGIVLAKPGEYTVAYKDSAKQVTVQPLVAEDKGFITILAETLAKNALSIVLGLVLIFLFFFYRRRKKKDEALTDTKKKRIESEIEDEK